MANHPNRGRGPKGPAANPTTAAVLAARETAGLTQRDAAALLHRTERNWQQWEIGERRMDPALFELFQLKTRVYDPLD
jgi:DNA-binding transcriptional regulator YiaG